MPALRLRRPGFLRYATFTLTIVFAASASAQQDPPPMIQLQSGSSGPTGSVTGTVIAQDTQKPVRFAQVQLQSIASASGGQNRGGGGFSSAQTDAEGIFTVVNVAPGDYYATATAPGYIPERTLLVSQVKAGSDANALLASLPVVRVAADSTSSINVTLERGGTIAGRVSWEDGSPAAGLIVSALSLPQSSNQLPVPLQGLQFTGNNASAQTDDRGNFRISGLPGGDYLILTVIQSRLQSQGRGQQAISSITVYSPGVFLRSAAKPVSVRTGEERDDMQLTVDLRALRTVSGHVSSSDGNQTIASGRVTLTDQADTSLHLIGPINAEGNFVIKYVPPGSYILQIAGASTLVNGGNRGRGSPASGSGASFKPFSQPVVVTDADLSGFTATLSPQ